MFGRFIDGFSLGLSSIVLTTHDDVIKWKHFPRYWPFVRRIHRSPVNSPHKGQWRGALMFTLICVRINGWVNNRKAGDLRRYRCHYDVIVMKFGKNFMCCRRNTLSPTRMFEYICCIWDLSLQLHLTFGLTMVAQFNDNWNKSSLLSAFHFIMKV